MILCSRIVFVVLLFAIRICLISSEEFTPLGLAQEIFSKSPRINILDHITGEYSGNPNGRDLDENFNLHFLLLMQDENNAIVAMKINDEDGNGIDYYLFFRKEIVWKMHAIRSLYIPRWFISMVNELEQMTNEEITNIINSNNEFVIFSTIDEYNFWVGNGRLILETDDNIINHFIENKEKFERLRDLAIREFEELFPDRNIEGRINLISDFESEFRRLYISSISVGGIEFGLSLNFLIGGILDNSVGFIYTNDPRNLPRMSPNRVIMIREIGDGWYIYKTT